VLDLTERKRAEEALRGSEAKFPYACEFVIRIRFPVPIGGAFRVVANFASLPRNASSARLRSVRSSTKCDALVAFFAKRSQADQHGHAAPIFPKVLLLEWLDCPDHFQLCISPRVALAPFRRRQVRSVQAARDKILSIVSPHAEKRVICLKNANLRDPR